MSEIGTGSEEKHPKLQEVATITRITQEDFLAQLSQLLAFYDRDGDGILTDEEWKWVEDAFRDAR
ncbi:hypothetical protein [Celeribacter persicus]|jgi:hypothetical protein|uniref:EF-hand domain-containing protein n=1 Tax=Celeribacter persicus TaxID=1651082 RepID=A0A2T5HW40_9RHOB|nr:hypothetical protein [Celeribacter persicus]PTQ75810.1 hypothetical protein C8N42_101351 [Celeribacter persicus]